MKYLFDCRNEGIKNASIQFESRNREEREEAQQDWRRCDSSVDDIFRTVAAAAEAEVKASSDRSKHALTSSTYNPPEKLTTDNENNVGRESSVNSSSPSCRLQQPILTSSSNRRSSSSVVRVDKHVRLTLPSYSPIPSNGSSSLQPRLSILASNNGLNIGGGGGGGPTGGRYRRRRAVTTSDFKSCAMVQNKLKLGDIM